MPQTAGQFVGVFCLMAVLSLLKRHLDRRRANPKNLPYPPGPPPRPIIGNLFDLARENEIEHYLEMSKKYGSLVYFSVLGRNILFVNSFQVATDLFERRSANYSDRTHSVMIHELMGWEWAVGHMPYGEEWKTHRKMFHRQFQPSVAPIHWPTQRYEAHALLRRLLHSPNDLFEHLRHNAASVIMNVTYGINITPKNDRFVTIAEEALAGMVEAANPGAFLVDLLPFLKYVPEWVPGAGFQRKARKWKEVAYEMRDAPYEAALLAWQQGRARPSVVSNLASELEAQCRTKEEFEKKMVIVKAAAGMSYVAGSESTMASLSSFILAMILHPEVLAKAQEEVDRVTGRERLPEFEDRKFLPYISAIVKETLRWSPVAPLSLPHMVTSDDEYNGYFIPAGTIIVGNSWAILHDPTIYADPDVFNPDRFLKHKNDDESAGTTHNVPQPLDPLSVTFGYGRRVCPGRYLADAQIWISVACIVALFDIFSGEVDEEGKRVRPEAKFTSGLVRHPLPYKAEIRPRGEWAKVLIEEGTSISVGDA